jgi:hypothetical protein
MSAPPAGFPIIATTLALAMLSGCAANSPNATSRYQPPPAGAPAAVINVGRRGQAWSVDDAETPSFAKTLRLRPGEHRVGINCLASEIASIGMLPGGSRAPLTPMVNAKSAAQIVQVTGPFEAGKTYFTRCVTIDGQPRAWLADTPNGVDLPPGFTSICTRDCPR